MRGGNNKKRKKFFVVFYSSSFPLFFLLLLLLPSLNLLFQSSYQTCLLLCYAANTGRARSLG
jgi:hypothetical protein